MTRRLIRTCLLLPCLALTLVWGPVSAPAPGLTTRETPRGEWPLSPRPAVAARFDPPDSRWGAGHRGVDLVGHPVATVRTALAGTVRFAGRIAGRGVVVVGHGATRTTFEPVRATVAVGDEVAAGAPIGRLEAAGSHCFPAACLHWGWLRGDVYLDPLSLVGARPVRLVPPDGLATGPPAGPAGPSGPDLGAVTSAGAALGQVGRA